MTATTTNARFMANNFIGDDIVISSTSESGSYPLTNLLTTRRDELWKAGGYFEIDSTNNKLYFNDGSARTATIASGGYSPSGLITAIAAAVVASGSSVTCTASAYLTAPYIWQLVFSSSVTLSLSSTSAAVWDTLGFTGSTDRTGTTFVADAARAHTYEAITWNLGVARTPTFFGAFAEHARTLSLSQGATLTLQASNLDSWASPPLSVSLTRDDRGIFEFLDSQSTSDYEYWRLKIVDRTNALGSAGISLGYVYLGDHFVMPEFCNLGSGYELTYTDLSTMTQARTGARYFSKLPRVRSWSGLSVGVFRDATQRRVFEQLVYDLGQSEAFVLSLDPALEVSSSLAEQTFLARLNGDTVPFRHIFGTNFAVSLGAVEVA